MKYLDGIYKKKRVGCPKCRGTHHPRMDCGNFFDFRGIKSLKRVSSFTGGISEL